MNQKKNHMKIDEKRVYNEFDIDDSVENKISDDFSSKKQFFRQKNNSFTRKSTRQKASIYLNVFVFKRKRDGGLWHLIVVVKDDWLSS